MDTKISQLKQEQITGNETVFEDINPKTVTNAVVNSDTGELLSDIISRMWNSINNKLSRVVNSVNGETGVVILDADSVGLGKVDNVSFTEIKEWVLEQIRNGNKGIRLYDSLYDVETVCATNDRNMNGIIFFTSKGFNNDNFHYIGFYYWDSATNKLLNDRRAINVIASTDNSIIFNEVVGSKNYSNGKIGVNIAPDEDALKIKDGTDKQSSGLYIDKTKLGGGTLLYCDGVYGTGLTTDVNALLYYGSTSPSTAPLVDIYIDDIVVTGYTFKLRASLTLGQFILCNFKDYRTFVAASSEIQYDTPPVIPSGMCPTLMGRQPALGRVTQVPNTKTGVTRYAIRFYTIKYPTGWGLKIMNIIQDTQTPSKVPVVKVAEGRKYFTASGATVDTNISGLQVFASRDDTAPGSQKTNPIATAQERTVVFPSGFYSNHNDGGLSVVTDVSLCVIPGAMYKPESPKNNSRPDDSWDYTDTRGFKRYYGSAMTGNWQSRTSYHDYDHYSESYGMGAQQTSLGINLNKLAKRYTAWKDSEIEERKNSNEVFANISGLRIDLPSKDCVTAVDAEKGNYARNINAKWMGLTNDEWQTVVEHTGSTGGLSVNVGDFLEIGCPENYIEKAEEFYDGGKVNVRIGKGLCSEITGSGLTNRIAVNCGSGITTGANGAVVVKVDQTRNDLGFDMSGNLIVKNFKPALRALKIVDTVGNHIWYSPSGEAYSSTATEVEVVKLGAGLIISSD